MKAPKNICHFNGCKVSCIGNKCNMLCATGYTYVTMLIMDNKWKNHQNIFWFGNETFCQVFEFLVIEKWVHTCNDLHNEQVVTFGAYTYFNGCKMCYIGNKTTCYVWMDTHT
jgi:hypothetical protein